VKKKQKETEGDYPQISADSRRLEAQREGRRSNASSFTLISAVSEICGNLRESADNNLAVSSSLFPAVAQVSASSADESQSIHGGQPWTSRNC
jgi:hypothetical protein